MPEPKPLSRDDLFRSGAIYYNGVLFPPLTKSKGTYEPVYDDSGRIVKYVKGKISIEAIMYPGCLDNPTADLIPYYTPIAHPGLTAVESAGKDITTDTTMKTLRNKLEQSCKHLIFEAQGYGLIDLNGPRTIDAKDVDNGPKPTMITWTPLTNKMAKVVWDCEFCFTPCTDGSIPTSYIAQFPFSVDVAISSSGLTTRTISGCYERGLTRVNGKSQPFSLLDDEKMILRFFPLLKQFKREQNFTMSNDRRKTNFVITDTEVDSDDAFGEGVEDEDVDLSIAGQLSPGAFRQWSVNLSGSIHLFAGYPAVYAYAEISRLFRHYYSNLAYAGELPSISDITKHLEGNRDLVDRSNSGRNRSVPILRSAKYSQKIFGRTYRFNFVWDLFVSLSTLFDATGMFQPLQPYNYQREHDWSLWRYKGSKSLIGGFQGLGFTDENDIIVSMCQTLIGKPYPDLLPVKPYPKESTYYDRKATETTTDNNGYFSVGLYNMFDTKLARSINTNTVYHTPLAYLPASTEKALLSTRYSKIVKIDKGSSAQKNITQPVLVHKIKPDTHVITWTGSVIRLGYPVPHFNVESYGGKKLIKIGTDEFHPRILGNGIDVESGKSYSIHGLNWRKQYIVSGFPADETIVTDGHRKQIV